MALMFSRLAHNFAKNGYYPTDECTLERTLQALDTTTGSVAMLDPCCGEGVALAEVKRHLSQNEVKTQAYGIEFNEERAWHAKTLLDVVAHSDVNDMAIKPRQFGLLFLNPPYGDLVADKAGLGDAPNGRLRLEKMFFKTSHPWLAFDGILVLIVPHYALDAEFANLIAKSYQDVQVFMAPEQGFKQCVLFGRKRKADRVDTALAERLIAMGKGELPVELPEHWSLPRYMVPAAGKDTLHFVATRINIDELEEELKARQSATLWPQFQAQFGGQTTRARPPLREMSDWHLALALAAGQISGVVTSDAGRTLLIKGDTFKRQLLRTSFEETGNKDGGVREIRVLTDTFVPSIRAFDFTPGPLFGHLVTIQ